MPLKGVHCTLGYVSMEEHQKCMLNAAGPPCGISPTILQLITEPNAERVKSNVIFSPSSIASCHRQRILSNRHDWYLDVRQGYKMTRGSIVHKGLSHEPGPPGTLGAVREMRMKAEINTKFGPQIFHGQFDEVTLLSVTEQKVLERENNLVGWTGETRNILHVRLADYKTKSEVGHDLIAPDKKHVHQVNEYAWLLKKVLPTYINDCTGHGDPEGCTEPTEHLFLNTPVMPRIDELVVDELSITYMDMVKPRTFSSRGFLYDQGKMLSDRVNGRWVRRKPVEYQELELEPIHQFKNAFTESLIRKGIEEQIEAEQLLAPPLTGDEARYMCRSCAVREICYETGVKEGYSMEDQKPFVEGQ